MRQETRQRELRKHRPGEGVERLSRFYLTVNSHKSLSSAPEFIGPRRSSYRPASLWG